MDSFWLILSLKTISESKHYKGFEKALKAILGALREIFGLLRLMYEENCNYAWIVRVLTKLCFVTMKTQAYKN